MENKKPIGIIGAMAVEVKELIAHMEESGREEIAGLVFHRGILDGVDCVVAQCSPGKVNSAVCAQIMISTYHPRLVINIGVAGGVGVGIGDLVIASALVQHDFDSTPLGDPLGNITICRGEGEESFIMLESDKQAAAVLLEEAGSIYGGAHMGVIATGDTFVADREKNRWLGATFGAKAVEMEGASTAQACYMNGVPFAVLRAISDNANDDSPVDFPTFARESADKSARLLARALPRL
ncbi:5'-methylthioadenosine/adenosylhomocysteine nucleosidase [Acutalibacter sp. 1XD8-33]|uniref:5'-methylthioadenosine/adenosylhomocysteine nucleosidase n=1 Tax=Acutalibacter sp. 1XD8-33 TaxID=2320081 RepID=UPI000EA30B4C|nr:5'-methylthioadenosine/adenosylhomocysteine nucleosidase [Acutalibacter sp. 1XD8-33]RKJ41611.1 5'-methylthioadenosine/adenosylhomocysteine nucleosidase [Acutalibacter sp. 1XD8-33]